jgi:hypothetical protein
MVRAENTKNNGPRMKAQRHEETTENKAGSKQKLKQVFDIE